MRGVRPPPPRRSYYVMALLFVGLVVVARAPGWPALRSSLFAGGRAGGRRESCKPLPLGDNASYVAACIVVRDEHCDIREWVLHHASIGVGKVYLFDTQSELPMEQALQDLIGTGMVEYQYVTNTTEWLSQKLLQPRAKAAARGLTLNWQRAIYPHCAQQLGGGHKWMAFIDADEFIVLQDGVSSLPDLLRPHEAHGGVVLHWRMFSRGQRALRPAAGVLASYTTCCDGGWGSRLYKSIVQPQYVESYISPHHFNYAEGKGAVDTRGRPAPDPHGAQARGFCALFWQLTLRRDVDVYWGAALHHYFSRSLYDFHVKTQRRSGAGGVKTLAELIRLDAQCRQECRQAEEAGRRLGAQFNFTRGTPAVCYDPAAALNALGGPWANWGGQLPPDGEEGDGQGWEGE